MKKILILLALIAGLMCSGMAMATGLATCDSGPEEDWQSQETLKAQLEEKGWIVRRIKVDGGCFEVYALNEKEQRVEAYFHPVTLERIETEKH